MRFIIAGNYSRNLVIFRGNLIRALRARGHQVVAIGPEDDVWVKTELGRLGAEFRLARMSRSSLNAVDDLRFLFALLREFWSMRPDAVLTFTHKPNALGALACSLLGRIPHIFMIEGLGYSFIDVDSPRKRIAHYVSRALYWLVFRLSRAAIFLNPDDQGVFESLGLIKVGFPILLLQGIGVDLTRFRSTPIPSGPFSFLLVARLLRTKGVFEYCEAARMVKRKFPSVRFDIVGASDPGRDGVDPERLDEYVKEGVVTLHGQTNRVEDYYKRCSVYVLPSYREGFPVTIMEAMAVGRAVIATDVPGCRSAVRDGISGILVPAKDEAALAAAMIALIQDSDLAGRMGQVGRRIAETAFDETVINAQQRDLLEGSCERAVVV